MEIYSQEGPLVWGILGKARGYDQIGFEEGLGRAFTTLDSLQTLIVEIENILNNRPLTTVPTDINDPDPITPAHLLYGRKIVCVPYHVTPEDICIDPDLEIQTLH